MDNPLVKQDLVAAILALREDVERQLKAKSIILRCTSWTSFWQRSGRSTSLRPPPTQRRVKPPLSRPFRRARRPAPETPAEAPVEEVMTLHGVVEQQVGDPSWAPREASPS